MGVKDLALAFRNVFRHRVRSAIALSAIVFGVAALLQSGGFIEWIFLNLRETTIKSRLGHIQVTRPNYFTDGTADPFAFLLSGQANEFDRIKATAGVQVVTPRLSFGGLLSHRDVTVSFLGEGVDPEKENAVSGLLSITAGTNLSAGDPKGVILGEGLAATVGARPGDQVVLLASTASGGMNAVELRVLGLFATYTKAFDDVALRLPIAAAEELLRVDGAHTWVVLLDKTENTPEMLRQFRARFPEASSRLAFRPWSEMADFYNKTVKLFSRQMGVVDLIIALIIVLSISNTLTKSVLERTGEIGTLMATGIPEPAHPEALPLRRPLPGPRRRRSGRPDRPGRGAPDLDRRHPDAAASRIQPQLPGRDPRHGPAGRARLLDRRRNRPAREPAPGVAGLAPEDRRRPAPQPIAMLKLAFRNIFRQKMRTALTLAAIAFGVAGLILSGGFVEDIFVQLREATIHARLGHVQVYRAGFTTFGRGAPYQYMISDATEQMERLRKVDHVEDVLPRLQFAGLLSNGKANYSVIGDGVDPDKEARLGSYVPAWMKKGVRQAQQRAFTLVAGRQLARRTRTESCSARASLPR